jgi:hypothetical protein
MMNKFEGHGNGIAKVKYQNADFQVITPGSFVVCAVTGELIALDMLKYWSWERQEAYVSAEASLKRELELHPELRRSK